MPNELADLLAQKRFDELLRRLDDGADRQKLLAELEPAPDGDWTAETSAGEQFASEPDANRIWDEVASGQLRDPGDNEDEALARELALSLGAHVPLQRWYRRLNWGQIAASGLAAAALTLAVMSALPARRMHATEVYPSGALLSMVDQQIRPRMTSANRAGLAQVLDSYGSLQTKGAEAPLEQELLKLLLIYKPTEEELAKLRVHLGFADDTGTVK